MKFIPPRSVNQLNHTNIPIISDELLAELWLENPQDGPQAVELTNYLDLPIQKKKE